MCGIIGFVGEVPAAPLLLEGMRKLEYRGYDSAGMAAMTEDRILLKKGIGKLDEVNEKIDFLTLPGNVGIGHVRWATHGSVHETNAHPHPDCRYDVVVVHNGVIKNYKELKHRLLQKGHIFRSDTDTEVISHLIEDYMNKGLSLERAILQITQVDLQGSWALLAMTSDNTRKIVASRKGSPLVVGISNDMRSKFVASDALAFLDHANDVVFLEDGETAVIEDDITFLGSNGLWKEKKFITLDWDPKSADKGDYKYFMEKEIAEAPQALEYALLQDREQIKNMAQAIKDADQVIFTACGSSRYAAIVGRYLLSRISNKMTEVIMGSELHYFEESITENTLVIAISQSGETADVIQGLEKAKEKGATVFSIINTIGSSIARMSDQVIYLNCGPEIGVAATKSFVSQLAILYILAFTVVDNMNDGLKALKRIIPKLKEVYEENKLIMSGLAEGLKDSPDFYYIARGGCFAIANEGALKLKELSYIHAEGLPAGELKHGTLSLIEPGTPVVALCPDDYTLDEMMINISEVKSRGAFVIGVAEQKNDLFDIWIKTPPALDVFYPLVSIVPLQLLAYHLAVARGKDPDKPRNLAKSVTVL